MACKAGSIFCSSIALPSEFVIVPRPHLFWSACERAPTGPFLSEQNTTYFRTAGWLDCRISRVSTASPAPLRLSAMQFANIVPQGTETEHFHKRIHCRSGHVSLQYKHYVLVWGGSRVFQIFFENFRCRNAALLISRK